MSESTPPESSEVETPVRSEPELADVERRLAAVTAELQETQKALQRERGQREAWSREREGLRGELGEARRRLDAEVQAHAQTRGSSDQVESKLSGLQGELAEARRETDRQRERADRALRDLEAIQRELQTEQAGHRGARERATALEGGRDRAAQELAAAQAQVERLAGEAATLRVKLTADQTLLLEVQTRCDSLTKEVAVASEHAASAKRALAEETAAHANTRRRLEELREAIHAEERKRQRRTIASVLGGAALGAALMLRRRITG